MSTSWEKMTADTAPSVSLPWLVALLVRRWRILAGVTAAGMLLSAAITLSRPRTYSVTFIFVPQSTQDQSRGGLASLAGQMGLPLGGLGGQSGSPQLYEDLLKTREVLGPVARDTFDIGDGRPVRLPVLLDLAEESPAVAEVRTVDELRSEIVSTSIAARSTGAVTVRVRTRWPRVSLQVAEGLLESLSRYNLTTRQSQGAEERRFTEGRLRDARASLRDAEDRLQAFLQRNRQFANSPQLSFDRERLGRDVALQQQVVMALAQQVEEARIREVRDTPVISLLERPVLPVLPEPRGLVRTTALGGLLSAILAFSGVLLAAGWRRERERPVDRQPDRQVEGLFDGDGSRYRRPVEHA